MFSLFRLPKWDYQNIVRSNKPNFRFYAATLTNTKIPNILISITDKYQFSVIVHFTCQRFFIQLVEFKLFLSVIFHLHFPLFLPGRMKKNLAGSMFALSDWNKKERMHFNTA
jgi:hypothetical protein